MATCRYCYGQPAIWLWPRIYTRLLALATGAPQAATGKCHTWLFQYVMFTISTTAGGNMEHPNLFDAIAERDAAINSVEGNTDSNWLRAANMAVEWLAKSAVNGFTSDDVWAQLETYGMTGQVHDNRALGPVILRCARNNLIMDTGQYRPSKRRHCAPIKVWRGI
jgi:hypothetical protein